MSAKVAICVPIKNRAAAVNVSVRSLLDQDYDNYVILACDGISRDSTMNELMAIQDETKGKLIAWQTEQEGYINTMNFILSKVDADYFCFVDSDDFIQKNKLSEQVKFLDENPDVDVVSCTLMLSDKHVLANSMVDLTPAQINDYLKGNNPINTVCHFQSCMFRKKVLESFPNKKYFFDEYNEGRAGEGFLYTLHFLGYNIANIKSTMYIYCKGVMKDSMSRNLKQEFADNVDLLDYENKKTLMMELLNQYNPQTKKRGRPKKA